MRQFLWLALLSTPIRYGGPSLWRTRTVSITNKKSHTGFLLVPTSVTLNDLERRNSPYFALFSLNSIAPQLITSQWLKIGPAIMSAKYRLPVIGQNWPTQQSLGLFATAKLLVKSRPDLGVPGLNFFIRKCVLYGWRRHCCRVPLSHGILTLSCPTSLDGNISVVCRWDEMRCPVITCWMKNSVMLTKESQIDERMMMMIIIIIIIISLLKQLTNRSHKTQYNEIQKKNKMSSYGAHM